MVFIIEFNQNLFGGRTFDNRRFFKTPTFACYPTDPLVAGDLKPSLTDAGYPPTAGSLVSTALWWRPTIVRWRSTTVGWAGTALAWNPTTEAWRPTIGRWGGTMAAWTPTVEAWAGTLLLGKGTKIVVVIISCMDDNADLWI